MNVFVNGFGFRFSNHIKCLGGSGMGRHVSAHIPFQIRQTWEGERGVCALSLDMCEVTNDMALGEAR